MIFYTDATSKSTTLIREGLSQLADYFDDLEIEHFAAGSSSHGFYEEGHYVGPAARIDASFGDVELYILDDEIEISKEDS